MGKLLGDPTEEPNITREGGPFVGNPHLRTTQHHGQSRLAGDEELNSKRSNTRQLVTSLC